MEKIDILRKLLDDGCEVDIYYNNKLYHIGVVYNDKGIVCANVFNGEEYSSIEELLNNACIDNIPLKDVIPNVTDIYED